VVKKLGGVTEADPTLFHNRDLLHVEAADVVAIKVDEVERAAVARHGVSVSVRIDEN